MGRKYYDDEGDFDGTDEVKEGFCGKYTERRDRDGDIVSESRERDGFFGKYVETRDSEGNIVSESRERDGFFGRYVETRDPNGRLVSQSCERDGFFGEYIETRDTQGNIIETSTEDKGGCYLTTACARARGLPDDCLELEVLRGFRDKHLMSQPSGRIMLKEYYELAPSIVSSINGMSDADSIWDGVYKEISRAVSLVQSGSFNEAFDHYKAMSLRLKGSYLDNNIS
jgi:hypothetical protein